MCVWNRTSRSILRAIDPADLPPGCSFHPRCPHAQQGLCDLPNEPPALRELAPGHAAACVRAEELPQTDSRSP